MESPFNRRRFLKWTTLGLGAGALAPYSIQSAVNGESTARKKRRIKKAVMLGTLRSNLPLMDKFKIVKDAGFAGVEPNSHHNQREVLEARDATGLEIPSVCDAVHWDKPLSDPDPAVRQIGLEALKTALRDCKAYGGTSVLLVPAVVNKNVSYADAYSRSREQIRQALPLAEQLGVKIAIENVWNQFLLSPLEAARYVDEFKSPWVGWHFDVGNVVNYGFPEQWIRILGKRIQKLHIKEFSRQKRDKEGLWKGFDVDLLDGDCDWPAVMKALDEIGYEGWAIEEISADAAQLARISSAMDKILTL